MNQRSRRVRREATVEGIEITGIENAKFISVVKRPANQRPFSVIRSEDGKDETKPATQRVGRTKRNDAQQIAQVTFPVTYSDDDVQEILKSYGLVGFEVQRTDAVITAVRSDLQSIATESLDTIKLTSDGISAQVVRSDDKPTSAKNKLVVSSLEFNSDTFSRSDAVAWLEENQVDFGDKALDNSSGNFVLQRADAGDGEVRQLELAEGVIANVVRSDYQDIPDGFVVVVNEAAWSGWGWGMLDFDSKLAGIEVGEKIREGLYLLEDILRDVLFYSQLPIDSRKELAQRSLQQFGVYAGNLLDQLPRQLLIQVGNVERNDPAKEPNSMTTEKKDTPTTEADKTALTRGDAKDLILEVLREAGVVKPAEATTETKPAATEAAPTAGLTREDLAQTLGELLKPVTDRLDKVESTVVVRSDESDPVVQPEPKDENLTEAQKEIKRQDVFKGALPKLFG